MTAVNHRASGRSLVVVMVEISADNSCQSQGEWAESCCCCGRGIS